MASLIAATWIHTTMLIENDWGEFGTGFLVSRSISDSKARVFLASNKHVLNKALLDCDAYLSREFRITFSGLPKSQKAICKAQRTRQPPCYAPSRQFLSVAYTSGETIFPRGKRG
jgi:hypothetical protein